LFIFREIVIDEFLLLLKQNITIIEMISKRSGYVQKFIELHSEQIPRKKLDGA